VTDRPGDSPSVATARRAFYVLGSVGLVVAALYFGQRIFVPFALAILLTLVLTPVVSRLERRGLSRLPAVLCVVCLAFSVMGLVAWVVASQAAGLIDDLPRHKANVREKLSQLRGSGKPGLIGTLQDFLEEFETAGGPGTSPPHAGPVVRVEPAKPSLFAQMQGVMGRVLSNVSLFVAVILLVIALLLYREDTRNRLIRLAGRGRLTLTTRALDEAGRRISGYLFGHSAVNAGFGVVIGLGLAAIGIPYPALWGLLAGTFRFIPSVGVWLVAPLPTALAWISSPGFVDPVLVLVLFLVLDQLTANVIEPWVCGRSVGLAPVPLLLAVMFWTVLWGVVGLVLATPVTVCLAVLGRHVRPLRFLAVLLGGEAALRPAARYYQRLLARDRGEVEAVVKEYLADHTTEDLFDHVLVPVLVLVRRGRKAGELRPEDEEFILRTTREIVDGLETLAAAEVDSDPSSRVMVLGVPTADGADEAALAMLRHLLRQAGSGVLLTAGLPASGVRGLVEETAPVAILIAAVGPGGLTEAQYLCRRLRDQSPGVKIVVGRWGRGKDPKKARALLLSAGADRVVGSLLEARTYLARLVYPLLPAADMAQQSM
jgi:predicted PurR-regulated permease PerM